MNNDRRVVITGLGAITPLGNDVETFWSNLKNGVSGICTIDAFYIPLTIAKSVGKFAISIRSCSSKIQRTSGGPIDLRNFQWRQQKWPSRIAGLIWKTWNDGTVLA